MFVSHDSSAPFSSECTDIIGGLNVSEDIACPVFSPREAVLCRNWLCVMSKYGLTCKKKARNHKICFTLLKTLILAIQPFGPFHVHSYFL